MLLYVPSRGLWRRVSLRLPFATYAHRLPGQKYMPIIKGIAGMKADPSCKRHAMDPV